MSEAQQKRLLRAQNLDHAKKSLNAFGPQVQQLKRNARVDLVSEGQSRSGSAAITSTTGLLSSIQTKSDFEREFRQAVEESGFSWNDNSATQLPPTPAIQEDTQRRQMARIRTLLRAEQIRARRLKNIKSKTHRKAVRQKEAKGMQDLINKLDKEDPEAAELIKAELERKLSSIRLNRQRQARVKWSQAAQRFGGKEVRGEVSRQAQADADQRKELIRAVKGRTETESGGEETDSDLESLGSDEDDIVARVKKSIHAKVLKGGDDPLPATGLLGMKFMREAETRKRNDTLSEATSFLEALEESGSDTESTSDSPEDAGTVNLGEQGLHFEDGQTQQDLVASLFSTPAEVACEPKRKPASYRLAEAADESNRLPGWGEWAGEGVKRKRAPKPKQTAAIASTPSQSAIVQALDEEKLREPLMKYQMSGVPYPFRSKRDFEAANSRPLGPEWQSLGSHAEMIQPKVCARLGAVVPPIRLAKHLNSDSRAKLIDAWDNRKKVKHTKARFL